MLRETFWITMVVFRTNTFCNSSTHSGILIQIPYMLFVFRSHSGQSHTAHIYPPTYNLIALNTFISFCIIASYFPFFLLNHCTHIFLTHSTWKDLPDYSIALYIFSFLIRPFYSKRSIQL